MTERFRREVCVTITLLVLISFSVGCRENAHTGPGKIHWDRQACEHCQMVISERRHAVQIREIGERRTHAFDDLGCALLWLDGRESVSSDGEDPEIWVRNASGADWIDARNARFEEGQSTPMAYGFSSAEAGVELADMRARVRETERQRRSRRVKDDPIE
jgi:copper chaperone NosL